MVWMICVHQCLSVVSVLSLVYAGMMHKVYSPISFVETFSFKALATIDTICKEFNPCLKFIYDLYFNVGVFTVCKDSRSFLLSVFLFHFHYTRIFNIYDSFHGQILKSSC